MYAGPHPKLRAVTPKLYPVSLKFELSDTSWYGHFMTFCSLQISCRMITAFSRADVTPVIFNRSARDMPVKLDSHFLCNVDKYSSFEKVPD